MAAKTVKSGIFLPNLITFLPFFFINLKNSYNFTILQSIFFILIKKSRKPSPLKRSEKRVITEREEALPSYFLK
jgi:hypothetical protein